MNGRYFNMNVYAIKERPGDLSHIFLDLCSRTRTLLRRISVMPAWTGVHGAHQHEIRGVVHRHFRPTDSHSPVLKRLTHNFEDIASKLGQLIEEENSMVRKRDLAGPGHSSASNQCGI